MARFGRRLASHPKSTSTPYATPLPLDSVTTETMRQVYAAMPTVFARDIARAKGQSIPPQPVPTLKRERLTDKPELAMTKRRDTGDSKAGTSTPLPATPALAQKSAQPFVSGIPQAAMPARLAWWARSTCWTQWLWQTWWTCRRGRCGGHDGLADTVGVGDMVDLWMWWNWWTVDVIMDLWIWKGRTGCFVVT